MRLPRHLGGNSSEEICSHGILATKPVILAISAATSTPEPLHFSKKKKEFTDRPVLPAQCYPAFDHE